MIIRWLSIGFLIAAILAAAHVQAQSDSPRAADEAKWIWAEPDTTEGTWIYFRTSFSGDWPGRARRPVAATLRVCSSTRAVVSVNRRQVGRCDDSQNPLVVDVRHHLRRGENVIAVEVKNDQAPAGIVAELQITLSEDSPPLRILSDATWRYSAESEAGWDQTGFDAAAWQPARVVARLGDPPWGDVFNRAPAADAFTATPAEFLELLPGFKAELLYSVPPEQGSWVAMTFDDKGRLIVSDQYRTDPGQLFRLTLRDGAVEKVEPIVTRLKPAGAQDTGGDPQSLAPVGGAQGLCWAFDSLYVCVNGRSGLGTGLYRLRDTNGDGDLDEAELLRLIDGNSDHGLHAVLPGPDGQSLYIVAGNFTKLLDPLDGSRLPRQWDEDQLLPRLWDPRGHANGVLAPGGVIYRTDPQGKHWQIVNGGYRNPYDAAFNEHGELFTFDADMEWDLGLPWYRPTQIFHAVSGADFGWRSGSGKWPDHYPDTLPAAVDIGLSSPTGVVFGAAARFPAPYQRALYALDWAYGAIFAVHLDPHGASYRGRFEKFVSAKPLPVTDAAIGPDGALYFIIGGWKMQSGLYRVTYVGSESTAPAPPDDRGDQARTLRRRLEAFHDRPDPAAIDAAWPHLPNPDRFIRSAARIAIEHQDPSLWAERALRETDPAASLAALLALSRCGDASLQPALLSSLQRLDWASLDENHRHELLRVYSLAFIRMGKPDAQTAAPVIQKLAPHFPSDSDPLNRELARLLIYLESPDAIATSLALLQAGDSPQAQIHYAYLLRTAWRGWTIQQRTAYFSWFERASQFRGGPSLSGYLNRIRDDALTTLTDDERRQLGTLVTLRETPPFDPAKLPQPRGPGANWTIDQLLPDLQAGLRQRNFENGRAMYQAALCHACHRFDSDGGSLGPDLTGIASRFGPRDLLEAIIDPSKVIFDQYQSAILTLTDGSVVVGRVLAEDNGQLIVASNPMAPDQTLTIDASNVSSRQVSPVSLMPPGLLNRLNRDEVLDLMAYMISRGDRFDRVFR